MRVCRTDKTPCCFKRNARRHVVPTSDRVSQRLRCNCRERRICSRRRTDSFTFFGDNGGNSREQITEVVGEVSVITGDHRFVGEVSVWTKWVVTQEVVAESVDPKVSNKISWENLIEAGLRHFFAANEQEPVNPKFLRRFYASGKTHGGPVHAVKSKDVFAK